MSFGAFPPPPEEPLEPSLNPFQSPQLIEPTLRGAPLIEAVKGKVRPPAYSLCAVATLGMFSSLLVVVLGVLSVFLGWNVPNEGNDGVLKALAEICGPDTVGIQLLLFFVYLTVLVGAYQMSIVKLRPMAFVASILAMVNCGNLCCILGLPIGIWAFVVLCQSDVARAFEENY